MGSGDAPLEDILKKIIKKAGPDAKKKKMIADWDEAAPDGIKGHSRPCSFKRGLLTVNVGDSTRLYELTLKKTELINALNDKLGARKVKDIKFKIGDIIQSEEKR